MRIRRMLSATVGLALTVVVGLPIASWVGFPALAPVLAAFLLEARDIDLISIETRRPDLRGLSVTTLNIAESSIGLELRGADIRISWDNPLRAIREGLASVLIGHLTISLDPSAQVQSARALVPSAIMMPTALLAGLPTRHLEITVLTARGRIAEQAFHGDGRLRAGPSDATFSGVVHADALPAPVAVRATMRADDQVSLRMDTAAEDGPFVSVHGALTGAPAGPAFTGAAHLDLDRIRNWLDAPDPWPTGNLDLHLAIDLGPEPTLTLAPTSRGEVRLRHGDMTAVARLALTEPLGITFTEDQLMVAIGTLPVQLDAQRGTTAIVGEFIITCFEMDREQHALARLNGKGSASWPDGSAAFTIDLPLQADRIPLRLQLAAGAELIVHDLQHEQTGLAQISVRSTTTWSLSPEGWHEGAELALVVDDPARLELTASMRVSPAGEIDVELAEASLPLSGNDLLARVMPTTLAPRSGRINLDGQFQRSAAGTVGGALQARWQNAGVDLPAARIRGASGAAAFTYVHDNGHDNTHDNAHDRAHVFTPHNASGRLDVNRATTTIERIDWVSAEGSQATILMEGLEGSGSGSIALASGTGFELSDIAMSTKWAAHRAVYGEFIAQDVEVEAQISGPARLPNVQGRLRVAAAAMGVPVKDAVCEFDTANLEIWQFTDCSAALLGGELRLPRGDFDLANGSGYLPLAVTGMQLSAVLGLMQDPALDGTGILDGSLPLRLQAMQPLVEQGWIAVRAPGGVLAYVAAANVLAGIEQPALRLTLRAVRDLRYQRLESRVDYTEDGMLTLAVDLLGSNPEIEAGRPIQLNLNVTQNLLTLLQSLRLSHNIEQQLQQRMQRVQP